MGIQSGRHLQSTTTVHNLLPLFTIYEAKTAYSPHLYTTELYRWPNGPGPMGQHGHGPKKHDPSTARARRYSASAGTRHYLDCAWAAGPARGTSTGTTRLMSRHDGGTIIPINLIFLAAHDVVAGTRASRPPSRWHFWWIYNQFDLYVEFFMICVMFLSGTALGVPLNNWGIPT
jgi:hypothetical protein